MQFLIKRKPFRMPQRYFRSQSRPQTKSANAVIFKVPRVEASEFKKKTKTIFPEEFSSPNLMIPHVPS